MRDPVRIRKFNNGAGAILCNGCRVIVKEGWGDRPDQISKADWESNDPTYCDRCQKAAPRGAGSPEDVP